MRDAERNFGLDLLRCVAIAIVLANHALHVVFLGLLRVEPTRALTLGSLFACESIEWLFVLSGFLIGAIWIRSLERPGPLMAQTRAFWLRRWMRTLPAYYLFLAANVVLSRAGVTLGQPSWRFVTFSQNLVGAEPMPLFFAEAWSLALDEWFYLLLPILIGIALRLLGGRLRAALFGATAVLILGPMLARALATPPADAVTWDYHFRRVTLYHLDATGWGVLAAAVNRWRPAWWRPSAQKLVLGLGACAAGFGCYAHRELGGIAEWVSITLGLRAINVAGLSLVAAGTALSLSSIARIGAPAAWLRRAMARLSDYTYAIYLCHLPLLIYFVTRRGGVAFGAPVRFVVQWLVVVLLVAAAVFHLIEHPIQRWRERLSRRVSASPF